MKNFLNYLEQSQKTYEFRIKIANTDPAEKFAALESALNAYGLESLSKPKRLPLKEGDIDFPNHGTVELYLMDAVLKYPCNEYQLRTVIAERAGLPQANIFIVPKNHPEEQVRFDQFCKQQAYWLDDFSLYITLRKVYAQQSWAVWPQALKLREATAINEFKVLFKN